MMLRHIVAAVHFMKMERRYDSAIADFAEAIRINPKYGEAYYNRALVYEKKGEFDKARADFVRAEKLGFPAKLQRDQGDQGR